MEPDETAAEPDASGTSGWRRGALRNAAARIGAKVSTEGVRSLITDMQELLRTLRDVRGEYERINQIGDQGPLAGGGTGRGAGGYSPGNIGAGAAGGVVGLQQGSSFGRMQQMVAGFRGMQFGGMFPGNMGALGIVGAAAGLGAMAGAGSVSRFNTVLQQSVPISASTALTASMYGTPYRGMEMANLNALGQFAGDRTTAMQAMQIGLQYGQTPAQNRNFMSYIGTQVQASGGTMNAAQAAASAAVFQDPMTMRRAINLGVTPGRVGGQVRPPLQVAQDYIRNYERRFNVKLNAIDFGNMRSPGNATRFNFMRLYSLTDDAMELIIQAGMQTIQAGGNLDYTNPASVARLGLNTNQLALQMTSYSTTGARRDAQFFQTQEGAMVGRLEIEKQLQETLGDLEEEFSGLISVLGEFQRIIQAVSVGMLMLGGLGGLMGRGGGGLLGGLGRGGVGAVGAVVQAGAAGAGRGMMGALGARGPLGGGRLAGIGGAAGLGLAVGAGFMAHGADSGTDIVASGLMGAAGVGLMTGNAPLAVGAGVAAAGYAALQYFNRSDSKNVEEGYNEALTMTDQQLIASIGNYVRDKDGGNAGPKERGRFDAWARRRNALAAAALDEAVQTGALDITDPADRRNVAETINVLQDPEYWKNDFKHLIGRAKAQPYLERLRSGGKTRGIYEKYFGQAKPYDYVPIDTAEAKSLVLSPTQAYQAQTGQDVQPQAQQGDAVFALDQTGDGGWNDTSPREYLDDGRSWDGLDTRMKERLSRMFTAAEAAGVPLGLGVGLRDSAQQERMFRERHVPDPSGSIEWNGQRWRHVRGAAAAPPGRSMHEIGLAADLVGDLNWAMAHAAQFGLKHFANVNNEPWHFQPAELPNSRREFEQGGGTTSTTPGANIPGAGLAQTAQQMIAPTPSSTSAMSGANYSVVDSMASVRAPGMLSAPLAMPAAAGAPPAPGGGTLGTPWAGTAALLAKYGEKQAAQEPIPAGKEDDVLLALQAAARAGFSGEELIVMGVLAGRETGWNANTFVDRPSTRDYSFGFWGINMSPAAGNPNILRQRFGISRNEELLDPFTNARAARSLYDSSGGSFHPWGPYKGRKPIYGGEEWVQGVYNIARSGGLIGGDAAFDAGTGMGGGYLGDGSPGVMSASIHMPINLTYTGTGDIGRDAKMMAEMVKPHMQMAWNEVTSKRGN